MYDAVYSVATGDVAGVGCELAAEPRADGKGTEITFTTIFEGSPAEAAGLKAGAHQLRTTTLPPYHPHCLTMYGSLCTMLLSSAAHHEPLRCSAGDVLLAVDGNPLSSSISAEETSGKVSSMVVVVVAVAAVVVVVVVVGGDLGQGE